MTYDPAEHLGSLPPDPRSPAEIDAAIRDAMLTNYPATPIPLVLPRPGQAMLHVEPARGDDDGG